MFCRKILTNSVRTDLAGYVEWIRARQPYLAMWVWPLPAIARRKKEERMDTRVQNKTFLGWIAIICLGSTLACSLFSRVTLKPPTSQPPLPSTNTPTPGSTPLAPTGTIQPAGTLAPVPTSSLLDPAAARITADCRPVVDAIHALKQGLKLPDHYLQGDMTRHAEDFDPNGYFKALTHLTLRAGYTLDYLYLGDLHGGKPLLYARQTSAAPFSDAEAFLTSLGKPTSGEEASAALYHNTEYLKYVQADGSPEGYFELMALNLLGDQFYLSWHANYNDKKIFCDFSDVEAVDQEIKSFNMPNIELPQDVIARAKTIDYTPAVVIGNKTITLRLVTFSKWGGFTENIYVIDKSHPDQLLSDKHNLLVEYHIPVVF